jgi:hypothetical protein
MTVPVDLTGADIRVTIKQSQRVMQKSGADVTSAYNSETGKTELSVTLTQEETGRLLADCHVSVQVNWIWSNGAREATNIKKIIVTENLLSEVIRYGD